VLNYICARADWLVCARRFTDSVSDQRQAPHDRRHFLAVKWTANAAQFFFADGHFWNSENVSVKPGTSALL
jgi:hypothetical protein